MGSHSCTTEIMVEEAVTQRCSIKHLISDKWNQNKINETKHKYNKFIAKSDDRYLKEFIILHI
jgi:hypothetical protein